MPDRRSARSVLAGLLCLLLALPLSLAAAAPAQRFALVIGNADYRNLPKLKAPVADGRAMADLLKSMSFKVTYLKNLASKQAMTAALDRFASGLGKADSVLVYYAGRGMQLNGANYLVPVDAKLAGSDAVTWQTLPVTAILQRLARPERPLLVFLDAGEGPPLPGASGPGLATPRLPGGAPVYLAMAAGPNAAALKGSGDFSPFSLALLAYLPLPGLPVTDMMRWVRRDVQAATHGGQTPSDASTLDGAFALVPAPPAKPASAAEAEVPTPATSGPLFVIGGPASGQTSVAMPVTPKSRSTQLAELPQPKDVLSSLPAAPATSGAPSETAPRIASAAEPVPLPGTLPAARPTTPGAGVKPTAEAPAKPDYSRYPALLPIEPRTHLAPVPAPETKLAAIVPPALEPVQPKLTPVPGFMVTDTGQRVPILEGKALARAVQTELARLNCYHAGIDGDFGPNSQRALAEYLKAKGQPTDITSPTVALYGQLMGDSGKVCATPAAAPRRIAPRQTTHTAPPPSPAPVPSTPSYGSPKIKRSQGLMPSF